MTKAVMLQVINSTAHSWTAITYLQEAYTLQVEESTDPQAIGVVTAVDADQTNTLNAIVQYSILEGNTSIFEIDPSNGTIYNRVSLVSDVYDNALHLQSYILFVLLYTTPLQDRETVARYLLTISATNAFSNKPLSSTVEVTITVLDINDQSPEFDR